MKHGILTITLAAGCVPDAPESPSFQVDVMPILAANCVRCHGYPAIGQAPAGTRLDSFDNLLVRDNVPRINECGAPVDEVCGASSRAATIVGRVQPGLQPMLIPDAADDPGVMPPRFALADHQIETLVRWQEQGAVRGAPRADNRLPEIAVEPAGRSGAIVTLAVMVSDADHDLVVGEIYARVGTNERFVGAVRSGRLDVRWDTTDVPAGAVSIFAQLDDGAGFVAVELGTVQL